MSLPRSSASALSRFLEPLSGSLWMLFLVWTFLLALAWGFGWGDASIAKLPGPAEMRSALEFLLWHAAPIWIVLAAASVYIWLADAESVPVARRWALMLVAAAFIAAAVSAWVGWPLGLIRFTERLGMKLGPAPITFGFLFLVVVVGARELLVLTWRAASHASIAVATGVLSAATFWAIDAIAVRDQAWWLWRGTPGSVTPVAAPLPYLITIFSMAGALALLMQGRMVRSGFGPLRMPKPIVAYLALLVLLLIANARRALGG